VFSNTGNDPTDARVFFLVAQRRRSPSAHHQQALTLNSTTRYQLSNLLDRPATKHAAPPLAKPRDSSKKPARP